MCTKINFLYLISDSGIAEQGVGPLLSSPHTIFAAPSSSEGWLLMFCPISSMVLYGTHPTSKPAPAPLHGVIGAARTLLLQHRLPTGLQPPLGCSSTHHPSLFPPGTFAVVWVYCLFWNLLAQRCCHCWAQPCQWWVCFRVIWHWHCWTWGKFLAASQKNPTPIAPSTTTILPYKPNTGWFGHNPIKSFVF